MTNGNRLCNILEGAYIDIYKKEVIVGMDEIRERDRWTKGKSYRKYCFTIKELAEIKGIGISGIRSAIYRGKLNPKDIRSICRWLKLDNNKKL